MRRNVAGKRVALSRRKFLGTSTKTAFGLGVLSALQRRNVIGANERINIALIGCGGRGNYVIRGLIEKGAAVTYLCDLDSQKTEASWKFISDVQSTKPRMLKQWKAVLDAKDVDAVVIATPDHWHALPTIMACQAGKDVYVEKPHSHCIWESQKMVEAARKYKRIVQVGCQNRSGPYILAAREYIKSGKLGKIGLIKVYNMFSGAPFKLGEPGKCPEGFDWDQWLGPAPWRPYHQRIVRHGWLHFWDFNSGILFGNGIHQLDIALMMMGDPPLPRSVRSLGVKYCHPGDESEIPDIHVVDWDFGDFVMTFDLTRYQRYMEDTSATIRRNDLFPYWTMNATRIEFYGSQFLMTLGRHGGGWIVQQPGGGIVDKMYGRPCDEPHYENFLACIKSRQKPTADIEIAHASNVVMHMANIAHRVGNVALRYDAQTGLFDNPEANKLIKKFYRKGYEIPDRV
ncbi:MAG: Gfo/Idh/MocA family oxidoreductase [Verrucomicrobiae bacterium]|nr:Gfo/Idh/MocA family oxidoreductase [Verrucomicrobiae bacterium]